MLMGGSTTGSFAACVDGHTAKRPCGVKFVAHATRFERYMNVPMDDLRSWLPDNTKDSDVRRWSGSSPEERESAQGLGGLFHSTEEVDDFVAELSAALKGRSQSDGGEPA